MLYRGFSIGVIYAHPQWVKQWFDEFRRKINNDCISIFISNGLSKRYIIELKDGTCIRGVSINNENNIRGLKFDKVFIEPCLSEGIIDNIVRPLVKPDNSIIKD